MLIMLYRYALDVLFLSAAAAFVALLFFAAPYGRHARPGWGIALRERLGWGIMESPAVLLMAACFVAGWRFDLMSIVFIVIWEFHYVYRTVIFTSFMREGRHEFPVLIMVMAILFNLLNGYVNGYVLFLSGRSYPPHWLHDPRFIVGVILFGLGFATHVSSDAILRSLRKPGERGYSIPYGGLFRYVSCPNYFGEIIEWCGWALLTWSVAGLAFAIFTFANLFPRGLTNHRWYRREFADYPKERRAVIPFVA